MEHKGCDGATVNDDMICLHGVDTHLLLVDLELLFFFFLL